MVFSFFGGSQTQFCSKPIFVKYFLSETLYFLTLKSYCFDVSIKFLISNSFFYRGTGTSIWILKTFSTYLAIKYTSTFWANNSCILRMVTVVVHQNFVTIKYIILCPLAWDIVHPDWALSLAKSSRVCWCGIFSVNYQISNSNNASNTI